MFQLNRCLVLFCRGTMHPWLCTAQDDCWFKELYWGSQTSLWPWRSEVAIALAMQDYVGIKSLLGFAFRTELWWGGETLSALSTLAPSSEDVQLSVLSNFWAVCNLTGFESSSAAGLMYACSAVHTAQSGNCSSTALYCLRVHYHTIRAAFWRQYPKKTCCHSPVE